jgi:hypothetical protein
MYRKALGALNYTPERFGSTRIGVFLDVLSGINEMENERFKATAELIRTSTTILRNIQVINESDLKKPEELWHFPWDKQEEEEQDPVSEQDRQRAETDLLEILKRKTENGNSIKQPES